MRIVSVDFSPGLWPTVAVLLVLPLFLYLGFWQLDRAEQKRILQSEFEIRQSAIAIDLNEARNLQDNFDELIWRKVTIEGEFSRTTNILLDNQVKEGVVGYFVYTPFKLKEQNVWVLVNRGWVPAGESRAHPPQVAADGEALNVVGSVKLPPDTGILLAENIVEVLAERLARVQKLELSRIKEFTGLELLPYVVIMDPDSPNGFTRAWRAPGSGEAKHRGYAFQWFAMALAIFFIYLVLNIKRAQ